MKRVLIWVLTLAMLLAGCAAGAENAGGYVGDMVVVNCNEFVSLRMLPDTSSDRLVKVPLGAVVTDCRWYSAQYVFGSYGGHYGYILAQYLAPAGEDLEPEENGGGYVGLMHVVNVNEYVSLRKSPSSSASRLAKVPLGATMMDCYYYNAEFICGSYEGVYGYVQAKFLAEGAGSTGDVGDAPTSYDDGSWFMSERLDNGMQIRARREYVGEGERLQVVCLAEGGQQRWSYVTSTTYITELTLTDAFMGGAAQDPYVMVYNSEQGLTALEVFSGEALWTLPSSEVMLGGSISHAVEGDGTIYIGGYYGPDPVAVGVNGRVLWQSYCGDAEYIYWLTEIEIRDNGIAAHYDVMGDGSGWVIYGWNGKPQWRISD